MRADQRLFLSYLVLLGAVVAVLSFGLGRTLESHLVAMVTDGLRRELALAREATLAAPELPPDSLVELLGRVSGRRVTLIAADGRVLGDSESGVRPRPDDDYRSRPEVRAAIDGGEGVAVRLSTTLGSEHVYVAGRLGDGRLLRLAVPLREVHATVGRVRSGIFGVGLVALVAAGIFSLAYSRAVTRPLRQIGEAARAMAAGDLRRRVTLGRTDEFGELGAAVNSIAAELEQRLGQLEAERFEMRALIDSMSEGVLALAPEGTVRRANPAARRIFALRDDPAGMPAEAVARRPEFLRLVQRGLAGASVPPTELQYGGRSLLATAHALPGGGAVMVFLDVSELRRLEGVRRDFVANASHELKTPLTAIRGYSETLLDETLPPELARRFAEVIRGNAERLQRLVDDLLDLSRIESGGWQARPEIVELEQVVREAWSGCAAAAAERDIHLQVAIPAETGWLSADPSALRHILDNLFGNALRYTVGAGTVALRATEPADAPGWVRIEVEDTGSGIPAVHLPRIFERFYRVDPARSRAEGGTGLGLAIVRHLVEAHGGQIGADSQLGQGTTIWFTLRSASPDDTE